MKGIEGEIQRPPKELQQSENSLSLSESVESVASVKIEAPESSPVFGEKLDEEPDEMEQSFEEMLLNKLKDAEKKNSELEEQARKKSEEEEEYKEEQVKNKPKLFSFIRSSSTESKDKSPDIPSIRVDGDFDSSSRKNESISSKSGLLSLPSGPARKGSGTFHDVDSESVFPFI